MIKTVFKILIGFFLTLIVGCVIIEAMNLAVTSSQIHNLARISIKKSCDLYSQETYKREDAQEINTPTLVGENGVQVSGEFYDGKSDPKDIYNYLYANSADFSQFMGSYGSNYRALQAIYAGMGGGSVGTDEELMAGQFYAESLVTPINMGVTYLDERVLNTMFKWHIATFLVGGSLDEDSKEYTLLRQDSDGRGPYVFYKGFRIYLEPAAGFNANVKRYHVFDTETQQSDFFKYTNIDADTLNRKREDTDNSFSDEWKDERNKICVAEITYTLPMDYTGITPMKRIFKFGRNLAKDAVGFNKSPKAETPFTWDDSEFLNPIQTYTGGGLDKDTVADLKMNGTTGRLTYFVVR